MKHDSLIRQAAREELARRRQSSDSVRGKLLRLLSPVQKNFVQDTSRFKTARCSRRGGKTFADAVYLILECISTPNMPCLYLGLTRDSAKGAIWATLQGILQELKIPHEALASGPRINFHNGSFIQLLGADASNARNRIRGRKFKLVVVDEMGFFLEADDLIQSLLPTLADYQGTMVMTSSPGLIMDGFFYHADQGNLKESWSQYHWTLLDNPYFQKPSKNQKYKTIGEEELDLICTLQFGGNRSHPVFRREYLGEWVNDDTSRIYPYSAKNLLQQEQPYESSEYAFGVDFGSTSYNAITVLKYSQYSREVQIVDVWKKSGMQIDELAAVLYSYMDKYKPSMILGDEGGLGKAVAKELRYRYNVPMQAAEKMEKSWYQRLMAADLYSGFIKVVQPKCAELLREWDRVAKDELGEEIKGPENHISDATLYIYRRIYNTHLKTAAPKPSEEERMISQLENSLKNRDEEHLDDLDESW